MLCALHNVRLIDFGQDKTNIEKFIERGKDS